MTVKPVLVRAVREVAWAPLGVIAAHEVFASLFGHEPHVDPIMHFLGGAAIAYSSRRIAEWCPQIVGAPSAIGYDLIASGLACFAALAWEFGELASDLLLGTSIQRSATNTLRDLALGVAGALAAVLIRRARPPLTKRAGSANPTPT